MKMPNSQPGQLKILIGMYKSTKNIHRSPLINILLDEVKREREDGMAHSVNKICSV